MFDKINRYRIESDSGWHGLDIEEVGDGEWIKYEDVKHLLERSDNSEYAAAIKAITEFEEGRPEIVGLYPLFVYCKDRLNSQK